FEQLMHVAVAGGAGYEKKHHAVGSQRTVSCVSDHTGVQSISSSGSNGFGTSSRGFDVRRLVSSRCSYWSSLNCMQWFGWIASAPSSSIDADRQGSSPRYTAE